MNLYAALADAIRTRLVTVAGPELGGMLLDPARNPGVEPHAAALVDRLADDFRIVRPVLTATLLD